MHKLQFFEENIRRSLKMVMTFIGLNLLGFCYYHITGRIIGEEQKSLFVGILSSFTTLLVINFLLKRNIKHLFIMGAIPVLMIGLFLSFINSLKLLNIQILQYAIGFLVPLVLGLLETLVFNRKPFSNR